MAAGPSKFRRKPQQLDRPDRQPQERASGRPEYDRSRQNSPPGRESPRAGKQVSAVDPQLARLRARDGLSQGMRREAAQEPEQKPRPVNPKEFADICLEGPAARWLAKQQETYGGRFQPTPIQSAAIRPISMGESVALRAPTGTGKTLAYLIPTLHRLLNGHYGPLVGPRLVILAPMLDLQNQIQKTAIEFLDDPSMAMVLTENVMSVTAPLPPVLVTVPRVFARFMDHPDPERAFYWRETFSQLGCLVIDEADCLLPSMNLESITQKKRESAFTGAPQWHLIKLLDRLLRSRDAFAPSEDAQDSTGDLQVVVASATCDGRTLALMSEATDVMLTTCSVGSIQEKPEEDDEGEVFGEYEEADDVDDEYDDEEDDYEEESPFRLWPSGMRHCITEVDNLFEIDGNSIRMSAMNEPLVPVIKGLNERCCLVAIADAGAKGRLGSMVRERQRSTGKYVRKLRALLPKDEYQVATVSAAMQFSTSSAAARMAGGRGIMDSKKRLVLVAYADALRGIDLPDIDAVISLGGASSSVEYMHLAGRTARCKLGSKSSSKGTVVSIVPPQASETIRRWAARQGSSITPVELEEITSGNLFLYDPLEEQDEDFELAREEVADYILWSQSEEGRLKRQSQRGQSQQKRSPSFPPELPELPREGRSDSHRLHASTSEVASGR